MFKKLYLYIQMLYIYGNNNIHVQTTFDICIFNSALDFISPITLTLLPLPLPLTLPLPLPLPNL